MKSQSRRPTMNDVARIAGVGLKTVSRVVNNQAGVRPETIERVRQVIGELGYQRNDMASNLRAGRSAGSVGLVIEDLSNPFYSAIARGVEQVIREHDLVLITASSEEDADRERNLVLALLKHRVVGLIIVPTAVDHSFLRQEIDMGLAVTILDRPATGLAGDTVLLDNRGGAIAATNYLLARGHRRIALLGHELKIWTMGERIAGFRSAMRRAGQKVDDDLVRFGPFTPEDAATATAEFLDRDDPPTAFFACNNRMTVGILRELRRRGIQADVAGFDPIQTAELWSQPVALVSYDAVDVGRQAAELMLNRLSVRSTAPKQIVISTSLIEHPGWDINSDGVPSP